MVAGAAWGRRLQKTLGGRAETWCAGGASFASQILLNEFLKEHRKMNEQQKQIDALTSQLKEQAAQIQRVSAQVEMSKPVTKVVLNNP
jgi:hypothetical protein